MPVHKSGDSQLTLTSLNLEGSLMEKPLIPGLPDDAALNCLLRLPVQSHTACRAVCKRWHLLLGSWEGFFTSRKELGFKDPWLLVCAINGSTGKTHWQVLDLTHFFWHSIPAMPSEENSCPNAFRCVSIPHEATLFVCGGVLSDVDCPLDLVRKYDMHENRWTILNQMSTARSHFAIGVIDGKIYVAGGIGSDEIKLDSAEVLDPITGIWDSIKPIGTHMTANDAAVLDGKLLVTDGLYCDVRRRGKVYDPKSNNWETMADGLRKGWNGESAVVYDHLFVISDGESWSLKVYDSNSDSWEAIEGAPLAEQIDSFFTVNACESSIYVVGENLNVAVGHISRLSKEGNCETKWSFGVRWRVIEAPRSFWTFLPTSSQKNSERGVKVTSDEAVLDGKLYVSDGGLCHSSSRGQVYDPKSDNWEAMAAGLRQGWNGLGLVVYDHLFVFSHPMELKVYDTNSGSWEAVEGPPFPDQIDGPKTFNAFESSIYVVGLWCTMACYRSTE